MSCIIEITSGEPVLMGSSLIGAVVCTLSKPTTIKAVSLQFYGEESTDSVGTGKQHTHGRCVVIDIEKSLLGSEKLFPKGENRYPFTIDVPLRMPASFHAVNGGVAYYLKAMIKKPTKVVSVKKVIEVTRPIELGAYLPALQIQFETSTDRTVRCCGWSRGKIILSAEVEKRLFVIGEKILVHIDIINSSSLKVKHVFGRIMKKITIHFTHPRPHEMTYWEFVTKGTKFPGVGKHEEVAYPLYIDIPKNLHVPHIKYSNLFKISYQLQIIAKLSGFNTAMVLQLKIYFGHIPFDATTKRWRTSFFDDKDDDAVSNFSTT